MVWWPRDVVSDRLMHIFVLLLLLGIACGQCCANTIGANPSCHVRAVQQ